MNLKIEIAEVEPLRMVAEPDDDDAILARPNVLVRRVEAGDGGKAADVGVGVVRGVEAGTVVRPTVNDAGEGEFGAVRGGSRATAREIYKRMYEQAGDEQVKEMARKRLLQLDSFDQRDILRKLFATYKTRTGKCPDSWREIEPVLRSLRIPVDQSGAPLDPSRTAYVLKAGECEADLDWRNSKVPYK